MNDSIILSKKQSIERCVIQIRDYYARPSDLPFEKDFYKQDAVATNLQRAAELCIDVANHVVRSKRLGLPKESKEGFFLLAQAGVIAPDLAQRLAGMVGFRNVLVHEYQSLDYAILKDVIENRLGDLLLFTDCVLESQ